MAEYTAVKGGQLKLKGNKGSSGQRKKKRKKDKDEMTEEWMKEPGAVRHGTCTRTTGLFVCLFTYLFTPLFTYLFTCLLGKWRKIRSIEEMKDRVILEMYNGQYLIALVGGAKCLIIIIIKIFQHKNISINILLISC